MAPRPLQFRSAAEWRRWLEKHHEEAPEAILLLSKTSTPAGLHYREAVEEALCFGWIDSKGRSHDAERFTLRFSPRKPDSVWSESNRKRVGRLIRAHRMRPPGLATVRQAKASGAWEEARRSNAVPPMPRDLREALKADPEAWSHFGAWAKSYRAMGIGWVLSAKREETRRRRIARLVWHASRDERPGTPGY